jgi:hypothetical protein
VKQAAEPVAAEVAHHAHVLRLDIGLDRGADVAGGGARADHGNAAHHRLVGHLDEPLGAARDGADRVHAARVPVPAVEDQGHVDVDDVALAQRLLIRDAVADHVIDRGAGRLAVAAVHQRGGNRVVRHREVEHQAVDLLGRHAGAHLAGQHVEAFGGEPPGLPHTFEGTGAVQLDLSGLALRRQCRVDVAHQGFCGRAASWRPGRRFSSAM